MSGQTEKWKVLTEFVEDMNFIPFVFKFFGGIKFKKCKTIFGGGGCSISDMALAQDQEIPKLFKQGWAFTCLWTNGGGSPKNIIHTLWCHNYMRVKFCSFEFDIRASLKVVFLHLKDSKNN